MLMVPVNMDLFHGADTLGHCFERRLADLERS